MLGEEEQHKEIGNDIHFKSHIMGLQWNVEGLMVKDYVRLSFYHFAMLAVGLKRESFLIII